MSVNTADPGAGEPVGIRSLAAARVSKATELRSVHAEVTAAADTVAGTAWQGKAQQAFQSAMGSVTPDLLLLAEGLEAQAAALHQYAGQVQQIKDQQAVLALQRSNALTAVDAAQSTLDASHLLDDRVLAQERATGQEVHTYDILRKRARLVERIESEEAVLRRVDVQWEDLVTWRRHADRACAGALTTREVLGNTWQLSTGGIRTSSPAALLGMLAGLSATDLRALLAAHPELPTKLGKAAPQAVADWWHSLDRPDGGISEAQTALVVGLPTVIGALNGIAWDARYSANKLNIQAAKAANAKKITALRKQIDDLTSLPATDLVRAGLALQIAELEARLAIYTTIKGRLSCS